MSARRRRQQIKAVRFDCIWPEWNNRRARTRKAMKQLSRQFRVATWNMYGFSLAVAAQTRAFKGLAAATLREEQP